MVVLYYINPNGVQIMNILFGNTPVDGVVVVVYSIINIFLV